MRRGLIAYASLMASSSIVGAMRFVEGEPLARPYTMWTATRPVVAMSFVVDTSPFVAVIEDQCEGAYRIRPPRYRDDDAIRLHGEGAYRIRPR